MSNIAKKVLVTFPTADEQELVALSQHWRMPMAATVRRAVHECYVEAFKAQLNQQARQKPFAELPRTKQALAWREFYAEAGFVEATGLMWEGRIERVADTSEVKAKYPSFVAKLALGRDISGEPYTLDQCKREWLGDDLSGVGRPGIPCVTSWAEGGKPDKVFVGGIAAAESYDELIGFVEDYWAANPY